MERRYELEPGSSCPGTIRWSSLLQSRVSVAFFTVKTFRMDGRLEASRSLTPLPDRRTSLGISNRWRRKQRLRGEHPLSCFKPFKITIVAGGRFELTTFG